MNTNTLTNALRELKPESMTWRLALYSTYKGRDGVELDWQLCDMRGIAGQIDIIRENLLKKPVAEKPVAQYTPFLSDKENIAAIDLNDRIIQEQINDVIFNIQRAGTHAPEDFTNGVLKKPTGYAFYGERPAGDESAPEQLLFMRRGNPFLTGQAAKLFTGEGNNILACNRPVLKFTAAADFLLIGDVCYILSSAVEKEFSLESRHFAIAQKRMKLIGETDIVSDYERLEASVMKSKNAKKFLDFDKAILEHIARLPIVEREDFLSTYGVTIDFNGRMDTSDAEQCELIIDLLCCRSCLDPLGRLSVGKEIMRRE